MTYGLSKSRLIEWRQCPKRLWLKVHRKDLQKTSAETERAFRVGYEIGEVARRVHPGGTLVDTDDLREALRQTKELLAFTPNTPLFEATFERDGMLVRTDLLLPDGDGYRLVEVKAATSVKDYYLADVAIQRWVVGQAIKLTGVDVAHVDSRFIYPGGGDYRGLLRQVSVETETERLSQEVPTWISSARVTLGNDEPGIETGTQCNDPFECPFLAYCDSGKPVADYPLDALPRLSALKREQLEAQGVHDLRQVPDGFPLTDAQERVRRISRQGQPELLPEAAQVLSAHTWPRYYLDFETVSMPVPIWAGTRPYQKIPVQWSCHVEDRDGKLNHCAYLADGNNDPRYEFAKSLIDAVGFDGPIYVYNQGFELGRIEELANDFPEMAESLMAIAGRVVDLLPLTRDSYYHPAMMGSWSIKAVLPTIDLDPGYEAMEIGDGGAAESAWLEIFHPSTPADKCTALRKALFAYCELDTIAMVRLAHHLLKTTR